MLQPLLPKVADSTYGGHKAALWVLGVVLGLKLVMGVNSIVIGRAVAGGADGVPLDTFGAGGAQTVIALFAIWGLAQLVICLFGVVVLMRYRSLVSAMFLALMGEQILRKLVLHFLPIVRNSATTASWVNAVLLWMIVVGLWLSMRGERARAKATS